MNQMLHGSQATGWRLHQRQNRFPKVISVLKAYDRHAAAQLTLGHKFISCCNGATSVSRSVTPTAFLWSHDEPLFARMSTGHRLQPHVSTGITAVAKEQREDRHEIQFAINHNMELVSALITFGKSLMYLKKSCHNWNSEINRRPDELAIEFTLDQRF